MFQVRNMDESVLFLNINPIFVSAGNDEMIRKSEGNDMVKKRTVSDSNKDVSKNLKKYDVKSSSNRERVTQMNEPHLQDSNRKSGDNLGRKGAKGKVKEFVKIFNQDAGSKPKIYIGTQSKSARWRRTGPFGGDKEPRANTTHSYEKNHFHSVDKMKKPPNASTMVLFIDSLPPPLVFGRKGCHLTYSYLFPLMVFLLNDFHRSYDNLYLLKSSRCKLILLQNGFIGFCR